MLNIFRYIFKMRTMDELARKGTWIHDINPLGKLLVTVAYLLAVISCGRYDISGLLPFAFYPAVVFAAGEIPFAPIFARLSFTAPLILGIGLLNPLLERNVAVYLAGVPVSYGWISFLSLVLKTALTVASALLLLATTGMPRTAYALRRLRIPKIFVFQLLLTYRYIEVLAGEAGRVGAAYALRAPGRRGVALRDWGPLVGQMLLRAFDRSENVYGAMKLRGFEGEFNTGREEGFALKDLLYTACWISFFAVCRAYNLPLLLGGLLLGVLQ